MSKLALLTKLEAIPGKEAAVEEFLRDAFQIIAEEEHAVHWFALKIGAHTYGVFDTFENEEHREAHISGRIWKLIMDRDTELFSRSPQVHTAEIVIGKST